jgi:hypothetical protein
MRSSTRTLLRHWLALTLALGLVPAASGGALCLAHWFGAPAGEAAVAVHTLHAAHAAHGHSAHDHAAHGVTSDASTDASRPHDGALDHAPSSDDAPPCSALAACGTAAAVEAPRLARAPVAPRAALLALADDRPAAPAPAPDVPPPRG